jgi:phage shock protein A
MTEEEAKRLECENAYLKDRCAQLEANVGRLDSQLAQATAQTSAPDGRRRGYWHVDLMSGGQ